LEIRHDGGRTSRGGNRGLKRSGIIRGLGLCNITKCCTEVCLEEIHITDNAIIPLKEHVVDEFCDPVLRLVRKIRGADKESK